MVQSARVQKIVKGDDVSLIHQIMDDIAYNSELSRAPILVGVNDLVNFFYPLQDGTHDLIGFPGAPIGSYPTSKFSVAIPGLIVPAVNTNPNRGTSQFASALGQTVRAEILRFQASHAGNLVLNSAVVSGLASVSGLSVGQLVIGANVPFNTLIESFDPIGLTVTLTNVASGNASAETLNFYSRESHYSIDEVDIFERGFPNSLNDTTGGQNPAPPPLNLT